MGVLPAPTKMIIGCKLRFISTYIKLFHHFLRIHRYASVWLGQLLIYALRQVLHQNRAGAPSKLKLVLLSSLRGEADVPVVHLASSFVCHAFENRKGSSRQYPPLLISTQKEGKDLLLGNYFLGEKYTEINIPANQYPYLFVEGVSLLYRSYQRANPKKAKAMEQKH